MLMVSRFTGRITARMIMGGVITSEQIRKGSLQMAGRVGLR